MKRGLFLKKLTKTKTKTAISFSFPMLRTECKTTEKADLPEFISKLLSSAKFLSTRCPWPGYTRLRTE